LTQVLGLLVACGCAGPAVYRPHPRVELRFDASQAEAALAIARRGRASAADLERLFATVPYRRLKKREAGLGRGFTDEDFRRFLLSDPLAHRAPALERALDAWKRADLGGAAMRALAYLPPGARIRAKVTSRHVRAPASPPPAGAVHLVQYTLRPRSWLVISKLAWFRAL
jgi:hypothetical protein